MVGLWPVPVLRWFGAVVNGLMIFATPVDGGHYFIDVLAGVIIALLCLLAARRIAQAARWKAPAAMVPRLVTGE